MLGGIYRKLNMVNLLYYRCYYTKVCLTKGSSFKFVGNQRQSYSAVSNIQYSSVKDFTDQERKGKMFRDSENEFAHNIMESLASYQDTVVKDPLLSNSTARTETYITEMDITDFSKRTATDTFLALSEAVRKNDFDLESALYTDLIRVVVTELSSLSDENLINVLASLCLWAPTASTETPNFKLLWNNLDTECVKRIGKWSTNRQLLVADYWFHLRLSRITKYNVSMINALIGKRDLLLPSQFVQLLFYINLQRHVKPRIMHYIEARLNSILPSLSINEVGIVCLGFFKTRTKISDSFVLTNMIEITLKHISEINYIALSAILKQFKNSSKPEHTKEFSALLTKCSPFVNKWPPITGIHLILLGAYINLYHPIILDSVLERILPVVSKVRLKDIAKLLYCASKHSHMPRQGKKAFETLINELRSCHRQEEVHLYPYCLISCLLYLAYWDIYPEDLLNRALSPSFVHMTQEKSSLNYDQEILTLYYSAEIESPDNKGERLPTEELKKILQEFHISAKTAPISFQDRFLKSVLEELKLLGCGKRSFVVRRIIPYSNFPDIIMCKKRNGNFLPLPEKIEELPVEKILKPAPGDNQWFCLSLMPKSSYSTDNKMLGLPNMKKRQLKKLGYNVIEIPWFQFYDLSSRSKQKYLRERLGQ